MNIERHFVFLSVLLLATAAALRFVHLGYDLPDWASPDYFTDEGWWADAARGQVYFGDYFSDDFGTALLVTPAYTGLLELVYRVFGVGTIQTRALAACASLLTILAVGGFLLARYGKSESLFGSALLAVCPLAWMHARVGLIEATQELFLVLAFVLWFLPRRRMSLAFLAGAAGAVAVWMKPNALLLGVFPLAAAAVTAALVEGRENRSSVLAAGRALGWAFAGFLLCGSGIAWSMIGGHWDAFFRMVASETHGETYTIWSYVKAPGLALMSTETVGESSVPIIWQAAVAAPALFLACWLSLLRYFSRPARGAFECAALVWLAATFLTLSLEPEQPTRRLMVLLPPMALFSVIMLARKIGPAVEKVGTGWLASSLRWAILTIPLLILLKPFVAGAIMTSFPAVLMGAHFGFSPAAAGSVVMLGWAAVIAVLTPFRLTGKRLAEIPPRGVLAVPLVLVLLEFPVVLGGTLGTQTTFLDAQSELGRSIAAGETVMGHAATSLLLPYSVRTLRRTTPQDHSPPPNPDVWDRTRPRSILDLRTYNYGAVPRRYGDLIEAHGYVFEQQFALGPDRGGPRFLLELYRRPEEP